MTIELLSYTTRLLHAAHFKGEPPRQIRIERPGERERRKAMWQEGLRAVTPKEALRYDGNGSHRSALHPKPEPRNGTPSLGGDESGGEEDR